MLSLWAKWLVTKFELNSLKRYLWPVLYMRNGCQVLRMLSLENTSALEFEFEISFVVLVWVHNDQNT